MSWNVMFSFIPEVNDGLSKRPTYFGILDAFKSIKKSGGIRALYQVVINSSARYIKFALR